MKSLITLVSLFTCALAAKQGSISTASTTRRERNLDHLSADTLAYYLGLDPTTLEPAANAEYVGYDVAIMFYAQWDQNSHSLAPYWDKIGVALRAGTKSSNLIMGLFNCEIDKEHAKVCTKAGIKNYPTMMFIGSGPFHDTDPFTGVIGKDRSAGPAGAAKLPRTVKFQGNWQYTESIKDWIKTMQGLSSWHQMSTKGFLKHLRSGILGFLKVGKKNHSDNSLPVGAPVTVTAERAFSTQTALLKKELKSAKEEGDLMERAATHASLLLDNVLFPTKEKDSFVAMKEQNAWDKKSPDAKLQVLRTCVTELSLDYCSRLSTRITTEYIDLALAGGIDDFSNITEIEKELKNKLNASEPYCVLFDDCYASDFEGEACRPATCPFESVGCAYLTACFDEDVEKEYAIALGIIKSGEDFPPKKKEVEKKEEKPASSKKKNGWGFFG